MPRNKREYGDPSDATLANAIAYVHAAQQTKGLHMSTISKLMGLYTFAHSAPHYVFSPEALEIAKRSPLWHAYTWCIENGFRRSFMQKHDQRSIQYWNADREQFAYIDRFGDVFIVPETGTWVNRTQRFNPYKDAKNK